ncbi:hypothetical protein M3Y97_00614200 [Aphelenchoides bicaudatus]|nr:hypothetical protein M3Y97_00614200 [Aphelenchoides bicaudatus]
MILLLLAIAAGLLLFHQCYWRLRTYPKGPWPLPGLGNILSLSKCERWEDKLLEWREKYGNTYTYWMGPMPIVAVNDYKTAVDMFVKDGDLYTERVTFKTFAEATRGGTYGVIDTSGELWKQQRRFTLRVLRDFGLAKNKMQERVLEEMQAICENVNRDIEAGVEEHNFHKHTDLATGSVINSIVCGYRFSANGKEEEFYKMKRITEKMMEQFSDPLLNMAISSSFFINFPLIKPKYQAVLALFEDLKAFLGGIIDDHIKNNDYSNEIEAQDYIDAFLSEMHRANERAEPHYFSKIQLMNVVFDLWFAGQETTSSTMTWGLAYIIRHPEVQKRMQDEMDKAIGSDRMITVSDKPSLPYTQAVVLEIQRMANIVAINLPRKASRDVEINGKVIPQGTIIIPQISVIMADHKVFKDPKEFNPSRFIDKNGNFKPADEVIPFSIGKRQCLGEGLARMELFLFTANIINQYKLSPTSEPPTLKKNGSGAAVGTQPYKCRVEKRPWPLPFVGNSLSLRGRDRWETKFLEWREKYGPIYTFVSGVLPIVSVNDYDTIIELFVKDGDTYADRFGIKAFNDLVRGGEYGIIGTSGDLWREQRRFALKTLRDFGLGKNQMQDRILEEIQTMCEKINKDIAEGADEHDFYKHTDLAVGSLINNIVCGYRFSTNGKEDEFYRLKDCISRMMKAFADPLMGMCIFIPFLQKIPPFKKVFNHAIGLFKEVFVFLDGVIADHKRANDYRNLEEPQDFIDAFLMEKARCDDLGEKNYFTNEQLRNVCVDIWFAGQETTTHTLTWCVGFLIRNPEVQQKLHEELDRVIGSDRMITVSDKANLPYTQAVVLETQRVANIIAINSLRIVNKDVTLNGYPVKKGTVVIPQIAVLMCDPKVFPEPRKFNPSRFLDDKNKVKNVPEMMPFSFSAGKEPPSLLKEVTGASMGTKPYQCRVERRFK